jgi:hypothetical protein
MFIGKAVNFRVAKWGLFLAIFFAPTLMPAQEQGPVTTDISTNENSPLDTPLDTPLNTPLDTPLDTPPNTNPTRRLIYPRKQQSEEQQLSDQLECYDWTCDQIDWDPYQAYADLVDEGYAVVLTRKEMEQGLVCLATRGAEIGTVAGEIVGGPDNGAEIGAAIAIASGIIHSNYLNAPDDPEAQRAVSRYERNLRKWDRKYAGCLSRKGYQVPPS